MPLAVISGITGQDGALLASFLVKKKYKVIGLIPANRPSDTFRLDYLNISNEVSLRAIDLLHGESVKALLEELKPDEFYNLAALSSVGRSFVQPLLTFDFNTQSVINILEAVRLISPRTRFYQASSSEMFGNVGRISLPIKESYLFHPVSPYGISKASSHWLAVNYREAFKLKTCCGILFNHESALRPPDFVIKKIIHAAVEIKQGKNATLTLGNIDVTRDWGYAPAYIEAMWLMLQQEDMDDYLICSGIPVTLKDFVEKVFNHLGLDAHAHMIYDATLKRSLDLEIIYGDNTKAKKHLNWSYAFSTDELIKKLIADEYDFEKWRSGRNEKL